MVPRNRKQSKVLPHRWTTSGQFLGLHIMNRSLSRSPTLFGQLEVGFMADQHNVGQTQE